MTSALAFTAAALAAVAAADAVAPARRRLQGLLEAMSQAVDSVLRLGREGREPGALERRRLLAGGGAAALAGGWLLAGPAPALLMAFATPWATGRVLSSRRAAYRRAVEADTAAIATAMADALSGGHSLRGAVAQAAETVPGAGGAELRRTAAELAAGLTTERAMDGLRLRSGAPSLDVVVASALVHQRIGGDLAGLLRGLARAAEDRRRLDDEVRAATAQARFTGLLVVLLPLGGALLAELASPGFAAGLLSNAVTAWLAGLALVLQLVAAVVIRRVGRVRA